MPESVQATGDCGRESGLAFAEVSMRLRCRIRWSLYLIQVYH